MFAAPRAAFATSLPHRHPLVRQTASRCSSGSPSTVTAYIDTSVLLRLVLREPGALDEVGSFDSLVSSELIAVEACRTLDRLRLQGALTIEESATRRRAVIEWLEAIDLVLLRPAVLSRASEPLRRRSAPSMPCTLRQHSSGAIVWTRLSSSRRMIRPWVWRPEPSVSTCAASEHLHLAPTARTRADSHGSAFPAASAVKASIGT